MRKGYPKRHGLISLALAAALILTEAAGVLMPVPVYAQDELLDGNDVISEEVSPDELLADEAAAVGEELIEESSDGDETSPDQGSLINEDVSAPYNDGSEDENINNDGYVYVEETAYYFTFIIMSEGNIHQVKRANTVSSASSLVGAVGASNINSIKALAGENQISGWKLSVNGHEETWLSSDFKEDDTDYKFLPGMDYTLTAELTRQLADNIYIETTPVVYYDGRAHVTNYDKDDQKSVADLELRVYYIPTGKTPNDSVTLRLGTDYKIAYKNNVNASVKMNDDGTYEKLTYADSKRPCVKVTGLKNYEGFSADVYFDILPYNFGEKSYYLHYGKTGAYFLSGSMKTGYTIKNGKLSGKIEPKVICYNLASLKDYTLKKGTDYDLIFYRYNEAGKWIKKSEVDEAGRWLCTARGKGNFCGTVFGQNPLASNTVFNDGTRGATLNPAVCNYTGGEVPLGQFKVEETSRDLSEAKVTIARKSVPYTHGKYYSAGDLGIKVTLAGFPLIEGTDYRIVFDGNDFKYVSGRWSNGVYLSSSSDAIFNDKIWMANTYKVRVEAIAGNPNGYYGIYDKGDKVTVKGISLSAGGFRLNKTSKTFDDTYYTSGILYYRKGTRLSGLGGDGVENYFSGHITTDSSGTKTFDYMAAVEEKFNSPYYNNNASNYAYTAFSELGKFAGTYQREMSVIGPGINHGDKLQIKFKVVPLDLKKAVKSGMIKISAVTASYNAGGAVPATVNINFNGNNNEIKMYGNSTETWISDPSGDSTPVKLTLTGNTKPGAGYINISAGSEDYNRAFKGSVSKAAEFRIDPLKVTAGTIRVLKAGDYKIEYGKNTGKIAVTSSEPAGTLYAVTRAAAADKNGKFPAKAGIDLYQSYYANENEYYDGVASLKKLAPGQYTLNPTLLMGGSYSIDVTNGKDGAATTGLDFTSSTSIGETYDVYDEAVTITSVTVRYNGVDYELPADSKKLVTKYKGEQVRFTNVSNVKVKSKTAGEVTLSEGDYTISYGDNVTAGKTAGSMTVTLKKGASGFKYGGSVEFKFNIEAAKNIRL